MKEKDFEKNNIGEKSNVVWTIFSSIGIIIAVVGTFFGAIFSTGDIVISIVISIVVFFALFFIISFIEKFKIKGKNCHELALIFIYFVISFVALIFYNHYYYLFYTKDIQIGEYAIQRINNIDRLYHQYERFLNKKGGQQESFDVLLRNNDIPIIDSTRNYLTYNNSIKKDFDEFKNESLDIFKYPNTIGLLKFEKTYQQLGKNHKFDIHLKKIKNDLKNRYNRVSEFFNKLNTPQGNYAKKEFNEIKLDFKPDKINKPDNDFKITKPLYSLKNNQLIAFILWLGINILILLPYIMSKRPIKDEDDLEFKFGNSDKNKFCK